MKEKGPEVGGLASQHSNKEGRDSRGTNRGLESSRLEFEPQFC